MAASHPHPQQCDHPRSDLPLALTIFRCKTPEERSALAAYPGTENLRKLVGRQVQNGSKLSLSSIQERRNDLDHCYQNAFRDGLTNLRSVGSGCSAGS